MGFCGFNEALIEPVKNSFLNRLSLFTMDPIAIEQRADFREHLTLGLVSAIGKCKDPTKQVLNASSGVLQSIFSCFLVSNHSIGKHCNGLVL